MTAAARPIMVPVHMPEDDEELIFHDAPEAAQAEHSAPDGAEHLADHSDDEHDAYHDAAEDASHPEGGATAVHAVTEPALDAYGASEPSLIGSRSGGGAAGVGRELTDSNADADGFLTSPDQRLDTAAVHAPDVSPAGDQFRPYADQQPEVGCIDEGEEIAAETLTPEEFQAHLDTAEALKKEGNDLYGSGNAEAALARYSEALEAAPAGAKERAVYYANRAACQMKQKQWGPAAADCTRALEVDPAYVKALLRRCTAYEELDDLDRALTDAKKVLELDPGNAAMSAKVRRLEPIVAERREKMKEEMMGKLKELGNTVLGKFGMSLDNFKAEKDPNTGSYSIQFKQ